ncbi:hypothetical protein OH77DRAFT_923445 [Trametes cingulata]|nr:hypothetical protein OH77DRAFT_923445 [Trametes cingulata]
MRGHGICHNGRDKHGHVGSGCMTASCEVKQAPVLDRARVGARHTTRCLSTKQRRANPARDSHHVRLLRRRPRCQLRPYHPRAPQEGPPTRRWLEIRRGSVHEARVEGHSREENCEQSGLYHRAGR